MKTSVLALFVVLLPAAWGQTALPDAPQKQRPFAVGLSLVTRDTFDVSYMPPRRGERTVNDVFPGIYAGWRITNRLNLTSALGRSTITGNYSVNTTLSFNLFRFGKASP